MSDIVEQIKQATASARTMANSLEFFQEALRKKVQDIDAWKRREVWSEFQELRAVLEPLQESHSEVVATIAQLRTLLYVEGEG